MPATIDIISTYKYRKPLMQSSELYLVQASATVLRFFVTLPRLQRFLGDWIWIVRKPE